MERENIKFNKRYEDKSIHLIALIMILILCFALSFTVGKYPVTPKELVQVLFGKIAGLEKNWSNEAEIVIYNIRMPRVLAAALIGAGLSTAGAAYQGVFQNPMVSPDMLGASAGAGFGAAIGIYFSQGSGQISFLAFVFGLLAVLASYLISIRSRQNPTLGMVLSGIMISSLFTSATSFIKLIADPNNVLPAITYWLMGSLASIRHTDLRFAALPILLGMGILYTIRWKINILTLGEDEAKALGVNTKLMRILIILSSTLITAACVSVSGMIGWVGLVIPHFARIVIGCNYKTLLPASALMGASFLMVVDNIARTVTTTEIPIGILTAFIGAPFFLYLILKRGNEV